MAKYDEKAIEATQEDMTELVEWVLNEIHFKRVNQNPFLDDFNAFKEKMKETYHTCYFGVGCLKYSVMFNSPKYNGKVEFCFDRNNGVYKICKFDHLVKAIWERLKESPKKPVQLSIFDF